MCVALAWPDPAEAGCAAARVASAATKVASAATKVAWDLTVAGPDVTWVCVAPAVAGRTAAKAGGYPAFVRTHFSATKNGDCSE
jgi:hypothetical protein